MGKEILTLVDIEIEKTKFYCYKSLVPLKDADSEKVLVSNRIIGYLYNDNRDKPLHIILPKTSVYVKSYDDKQTKWMYLLIKDNDLLEKNNFIWDKVRADINKEFDSELVYKKEFLKTKIKSHGDDVTDFYEKNY